MPQFFFDKNTIQNNTVKLDTEDSEHIERVLRKKTGDKLLLCDGCGYLYKSEISSIKKRMVECKLLDSGSLSGTEPKNKITLFQCIIKGKGMDMVVRKSVEIGVTKIVPVYSEYSVVNVDDEKKKTKRWQTIALSAAKQSMRGIIPEVSMPMQFKEVLNYDGEKILCYEKEDKTTLKEVLAKTKEDNIGVIIGAEGGFCEKEIELAESKEWNIVTLGRRILKAESCGMIVCANILYEKGDL